MRATFKANVLEMALLRRWNVAWPEGNKCGLDDHIDLEHFVEFIHLFHFLAPSVWKKILTNLGGAQACGKEFSASEAWVVQG